MKKYLLLAIVFLGMAFPVHAAVFTVTNPYGGSGSFQEAIKNANNNPGLDEIRFNIPGNGVQSIFANNNFGDLDITDPVVIDGTTQPGSSCDPRNILIEFFGDVIDWNTPVFDSLRFLAGSSGSVIKGVKMKNFHHSIYIEGTSDIQVSCSDFDYFYSPDIYFSTGGISVHESSDIRIGGPSIADRNIFIHVGGEDHTPAGGVELFSVNFEGVRNSLIQGNYIGVLNDGSAPQFYGWPRSINIADSQDITVEGNVISNNTGSGILVRKYWNSNKNIFIRNNKIGTDPTGQIVYGNEYFGDLNWDGKCGITVSDAIGLEITNNLIAGHYLKSDLPGENDSGAVCIAKNVTDSLVVKNTIWKNKKGITVTGDATRVAILKNSIFDNEDGLGIDLKNDAVTLNDAGDTDTGPNNLLNFPVISKVNVSGGKVFIDFVLDASTANTNKFHVEFFANPDGLDPTNGYGEGKFFIGSTDITINDDICGKNYKIVLPIPTGMSPTEIINITSTATEILSNGFGSTSEFSGPYELAEDMCVDYGDAPDKGAGTSPGNYQTRLADNGASHVLSPEIILGFCADSDPGILHNVSANADDINFGAETVGACQAPGDDEDGIKFISPLVSGQTAKLQAAVSDHGYLNGWIDWNHDGDWEDRGEHIIKDVWYAQAGTYVSAFLVPVINEDIIVTYARFRLSSEPGVGSTGPGGWGEVEDYRVKVTGQQLLGDEGGGVRKWTPTERK